MTTIPGVKLKDVRADMPNYEAYKDWQRSGDITGIAVHHSAAASSATGKPLGNALSYFNYHVNTRGWSHGGYHYVILDDGTVEYALDEKIGGYHAGFKDPNDSLNLEHGQYWNNHYIAICLAGWFSSGRTYRDKEGTIHLYPEEYIVPTEAQMDALIKLCVHLMRKDDIPVENVRGHRELEGAHTQCPGLNFKLDELREAIKVALEAAPEGISPDQHVLVFWSEPGGGWARQDFEAAIDYIDRFRPDVTFYPERVPGHWQAATIVGPPEGVTPEQEQAMVEGGLLKVERVRTTDFLDDLVVRGQRFMEEAEEPTPPPPEPLPPPPPPTKEVIYTVQPGDTLGKIARQYYGDGRRWPKIYEANRDILTSPSLIRPGQRLRIPDVEVEE
jgi:LysM repeat protein